MAHSSCVQLGVQWETSDNQMLQTEINKKNTEIKVLLNTQNLNWPFFRTMYRKLNIIGINNHSNIFKANKNSIQKAGSGYLCIAGCTAKWDSRWDIRLWKPQPIDVVFHAELHKAALGEVQSPGLQNCVCYKTHNTCPTNSCFSDICLYASMPNFTFWVVCLDMPILLIDPKINLLCGNISPLRLCISRLPARHRWSSCCSILCSCSLHASNSHWQKMQIIQTLHCSWMDTLKVPTKPWPNPRSFLPSVLSYPDSTRIPCIREATNCKNPAAAQGRVTCRSFSGKRATKEGKEEILLMFSCSHQKVYFHRKSWGL